MSRFDIGKKMLITTDEWFYAPDGISYRGVFGTLKKVMSDSDLLGIKTNRHSTNWYVQIGNMMIAGCRIHYAIVTDDACFDVTQTEDVHEGKMNFNEVKSRIYNADVVYRKKRQRTKTRDNNE